MPATKKNSYIFTFSQEDWKMINLKPLKKKTSKAWLVKSKNVLALLRNRLQVKMLSFVGLISKIEESTKSVFELGLANPAKLKQNLQSVS